MRSQFCKSRSKRLRPLEFIAIELVSVLIGLIIGGALASRRDQAQYRDASYLRPVLEGHYSEEFYRFADQVEQRLASFEQAQEITGGERLCYTSWLDSPLPLVDLFYADFIVIVEPPKGASETVQDWLNYCYVHEIGHLIDHGNASGSISETMAFRTAVEATAREAHEPQAGEARWEFEAREHIAPFPGVNGNPLSGSGDQTWGGYGELYADLFKLGNLAYIPPRLRIFYVEWINLAP